MILLRRKDAVSGLVQNRQARTLKGRRAMGVSEVLDVLDAGDVQATTSTPIATSSQTRHSGRKRRKTQKAQVSYGKYSGGLSLVKIAASRRS